MGGQALRRTERIRRRPDFERVYSSGARVHGRFMTLFVLPGENPTARLGVAATRKLGSAVVRNRAKRLARELFRRGKGPPGLDIVIVPRREMLDAPFATLEDDYKNTLERAVRHPPATSRQARRAGRGRRPRAAERV